MNKAQNITVVKLCEIILFKRAFSSSTVINWPLCLQKEVANRTRLVWSSGVSLSWKTSLWMSMLETWGQKLTPWLGKTKQRNGTRCVSVVDIDDIENSILWQVCLFVFLSETRMKTKYSTLAGNLMNCITGIPWNLFLMISTEQRRTKVRTSMTSSFQRWKLKKCLRPDGPKILQPLFINWMKKEHPFVWPLSSLCLSVLLFPASYLLPFIPPFPFWEPLDLLLTCEKLWQVFKHVMFCFVIVFR